ncbi:hypothetical protein L3X38_013956 [Prunus dulcis]|uniref:Uncharacterized protein n=1 Tax=Prunus dulcis TaxID=3755 RepID=A0AAD4WPF0_PRUDU|nr:hypothetical protein L3X38_013956 [Prunus dulcis]
MTTVKSWGFVGDVPVGLDVVAATECAAIREGLILAVQLGFNVRSVAAPAEAVAGFGDMVSGTQRKYYLLGGKSVTCCKIRYIS